jgi:hypothetical protein
MNSELLKYLIIPGAVALTAVNIHYSIRHKRFVNRLFHILGKEKDPLQDVETAKLLIAFGRNKQAIMKLKLALVDAPDRADIALAIDELNKAAGGR